MLAGHGRRGVPALVGMVAAASGLWRRPVRLASTQLLPGIARSALRGPVRAAVIDLHDHPGYQAESLGIDLAAGRRRDLDREFAANADAFERLLVPSASFAELCRLPADRVIVAVNGTDTSQIRQHPPAKGRVVAMASGAAPGRGIELLIAAMAGVRDEAPGATLRLALTATGPDSARYLRELSAGHQEPWLSLANVPYGGLDAFLADAAVLVIPHPAGAYMDVATPVKLFDSMAAGRPLAVTPRTETRDIVDRSQAGLVAASDRAEDLAEVIVKLLADDALRTTLGDQARRAAVERYDWRVVSRGVAEAILD